MDGEKNICEISLFRVKKVTHSHETTRTMHRLHAHAYCTSHTGFSPAHMRDRRWWHFGHLSRMKFGKSCSHDCIQWFQHCKKSFKIAGFSSFWFSYVSAYRAAHTQCPFRFQETTNFMYGMHNVIVEDASVANNEPNRMTHAIAHHTRLDHGGKAAQWMPKMAKQEQDEFPKKSDRLAKNKLSTEFRSSSRHTYASHAYKSTECVTDFLEPNARAPGPLQRIYSDWK